MKTAIKKAVQDLSQRAVDCADLAKMQRKGADEQQESANQQHNEARKLEKLGDALKKDVAEIKDRLATASADEL